MPSAAIQGLSGALSGVMSLALMYPLDNIRTRMQVRLAHRVLFLTRRRSWVRRRALVLVNPPTPTPTAPHPTAIR